MEKSEKVNCWIWCRPIDQSSVNSRIESEFKHIIWSDEAPIISEWIVQYGFASTRISITHGGDIVDEEIIATILYKITKSYTGSAFRIDTTEGDLLLIQSAYADSLSTDIPDGLSVLISGVLYCISEDIAHAPNLPDLVKSNMVYPCEIQDYFTKFVENTSKKVLYHHRRMFIPVELKRLLIFDPSIITTVTKNSFYRSDAKLENIRFVEYPVKFRRYHYALLDSNPIRVPREFSSICSSLTSRTYRVSYLLTLGYIRMKNDPQHEKLFNQANMEEFDELNQMDTNQNEDGDEWLDAPESPQTNFQNIGAEMAERFGAFMQELSNFDKVETEGPINFDVDIYKSKIDHFFSSSYESDNECAEEDQLEPFLENEDDKELRFISQTGENINQFASECWNDSLNSQPETRGPANDYINLFHLQK